MPTTLLVTKRDGSKASFDISRIIRVISLATFDARHGTVNPHQNEVTARYGLSAEEYARCEAIGMKVGAAVVEQFGAAGDPGVEAIQDLVEYALLEANELEVLKKFYRHRMARAEVRPAHHVENGLQEYIAVSRYCRFDETLGRREIWAEAVRRVRNMHLKRYAEKITAASPDVVNQTVARLAEQGIISPETLRDLGDFRSLDLEIRKAFDLVTQKKVLPSMRSLQFGGAAIEQQEARMFNCSFTKADRLAFFREFFFLLLCGCGVGFSVQRHHVAKLPPLAARENEIELPVVHFAVPDTIEGWADALDRLFDSYVKGYKLELSYHLIRARGAILKTSGGKAPGHLPLKRRLDKVDAILAGAAGRSLRPIEVYDVCMHVAKAVLSGGIRRSATICLFSVDDEEMMTAKTMKDWFSDPRFEQRSASNNSAVIIRNEVTREQFRKLFECQKAYGEPGFYFTDDPELGCNPCVEINLNPSLTVTQRDLEKLRAYGYTEPVEVGDVLSGVQMCNLTTLSGGAATTPELFFDFVRAASLIGTLQAGFTNMPYLGPVTRVINEREALIGVSICGILDNPGVLLDPSTLRRGAEVVKATNAIVAALLGINRAARTTCVKPEGTSSLVLDCASGIAPRHARRAFRRVQANNVDPVYRKFKHTNPHMCERSIYDASGATDVITFTREGPEDAIYREDITALRHLEYIKRVQENWVMAGRAYATYTDGHHNVSNTVNVDAGEWNEVEEYIWENRHAFTGVAMLSASGDKSYPQAPNEALSSDDDIRKWNGLVYQPVDYTKVAGEDHTAGSEHREVATACAGGSCEL